MSKVYQGYNLLSDEDFADYQRMRHEAGLPRLCGEHAALGIHKEAMLDSRHCSECVKERNEMKSEAKPIE